MSNFIGPIHGHRDALALVSLPKGLTESIVLLSTVECPILSCGWLRNSLKMVARCAGAVSFGQRDGSHTSFCGESSIYYTSV